MTDQANVQLADYLVRRGVVSTKSAEEYKERVRSGFKPLGKVLLEQRHLSIHQLAQLIQIQLDEPHIQLGELAVREGFCSREDLDAALTYHRENCPHILELALRDPNVDSLELVRTTAEYIRSAEYLTSILNIVPA